MRFIQLVVSSAMLLAEVNGSRCRPRPPVITDPATSILSTETTQLPPSDILSDTHTVLSSIIDASSTVSGLMTQVGSASLTFSTSVDATVDATVPISQNIASFSMSSTLSSESSTTSPFDSSTASSKAATASLSTSFTTSNRSRAPSLPTSFIPNTNADTSSLSTSLTSNTKVAASSALSSATDQSISTAEVSAPDSTTSTLRPSSTNVSSKVSSTASIPTSVVRNYPADIVDELRDEIIPRLEDFLRENPSSSGCTLEKAARRREWSDLSIKEREEYTDAVLCLQSLPPKSSSADVPGARSRYDDFANFLAWHRYFVWAYEQALRNECRYKGAHLYWNWDRYASDPANSPLFNGNASSISGNSANGGCVSTGPFKEMKANLGPGDSVKYNPRCLKRDISRHWASFTTVAYSYPLITQSNSIGQFQDTMQGFQNVHAGGHFTVGGDPGGDIFASPGDPAFFLHHGMIDHVWWLWQLQDLETRLSAVTGKVIGQPGKMGSASDKVSLGVNAPSIEIGQLLDTMGGELCYIYE